MKTPVKNTRRPLSYISTININHIDLKNPWVTAWWSASFPGLGHIFLGSYVKGFLLIVWEIVINVKSRLNLAIIYSFNGRYEMAKEVLDSRWLLLYIAVYIYSMWDSYRKTVELNKFAVLAKRENSPITPFKIDSIEINYLDKRNPWVSLTSSIFMPGLGHLCTHRLPTGFLLLTLWVIISYYSHLLQAVQYSATGAFSQAKAIVDPEWLLFLPSLFGFAIYDAYVHLVEFNKLFQFEQSRFLKENYQDPGFKLPFNKT